MDADPHDEKGQRGRTFWILLGLQLLAAVAVVAMALSPTLQLEWMRNMHLTNDGRTEFRLLQLVPKMYSFENQLWILETDDLAPGETMRDAVAARSQDHFSPSNDPSSPLPDAPLRVRMQHYPLKGVQNLLYGVEAYREDASIEVLIRSTYRETSLETTYRVVADGDAIVIEPLESAPAGEQP